MANNKKGIRSFAYIMATLSIIAVLLGVGVFYWLIFDESVASSGGAKRPISSLSQPAP
ncbi:MAG: hypothetical protein JKX87_08405 [Cycloclasticus sp.]|nr:hypothetical protein [Cycloclasticus sp.]